MTLDLPDEEIVALLAELDRVIRDDRYFLSPCIQTLTAIRDKLRPPPVREPLPGTPLHIIGCGPRSDPALSWRS
jgi:hypothetical protein